MPRLWVRMAIGCWRPYAQGAPTELRGLPAIEALRLVWARHYQRTPDGSPGGGVRLREERELPRAAEGLESPYELDARFRSKRGSNWTGYMVHLSETCEPDEVRLITHVDTTPATVHEAMRTAAIHDSLEAKGLPPEEHLVDAGYVSAALLVDSRATHGINLIGPTRKDSSWQKKQGGYGVEEFVIDWEHQRAVCPNGRPSASWRSYTDERRGRYVRVRFSTQDCRNCPFQARCTRSPAQGRALTLHPLEQHLALEVARARQASDECRRLYRLRAGVEGTISQGVRSFGLRRARYRGLQKTHLQHVATAAAINVARVDAWLEGRPPVKTRVSRFARLAA
jgi:transposase